MSSYITDLVKTFKNKWLFLLFFLIKSSINQIIITSYPLIQEDFELNLSQLGLIATFYSMASFIGQSVWINYFEKNQRYPLLKVSTLIWLIILFVISLESINYNLFLILIIIIGFFIESTNMFVYRIIIVEKDVLVSGKKYSSISAIQGAGGLIGALVAGQLQGFFKIPWRQIFLFLAIFLFTMVILLLIKLRKFPEIHFISTHNEPWRNILKIPLNRIILIITGTTLFCFAMLNSWIQKYFQEFHGLSQQGSVLFMAIFAFGQFLGFILGGFIVDHLYKTKHTIFRYFGLILVIITSSCMTIGFLIPWNIQLGQDSQDYLHLALETIKLALSDSRVFWTIVLVFIGNLINAFAPYLYLIIRVKNEEEVGYRIISIIFLINTLSQFICPVLGGLFGDLFGLRILMVACPIVILLTFFGYIKLNKEIDKCSNAEID